MSNARKGYLGAKNGSGVYQAIINLIPPHDTYIEPFLGTGAVLSRKASAARDIGIDLNPLCINQELFPNAELHCGSAFDFLGSFNFAASGRTVVYCDPPYLLSTRTSRARYEHEFTEGDHKALLTLLLTTPAFVMLSGYKNPLYEEALAGWWSVDFQAMSRGGVRTETVWCNFEPKEVHYHTFAGKNFTDRQRIKRKAQRWARSFADLPAAERQAILAEILQVDVD